MAIFAHSKESCPIAEWQPLDAHLAGVADKAASFAEGFSSAQLAGILGLLHDIGKARSSFQSYLRRCNGIEDSEADYGNHSHSGAGACWLWKHGGNIGKALSYCVAGHHAGLPDMSCGETPNGALKNRLDEDAKVLEEPSVREWISTHQIDCISEKLRPPFRFCPGDSSLSFWIRMMYSCLLKRLWTLNVRD